MNHAKGMLTSLYNEYRRPGAKIGQHLQVRRSRKESLENKKHSKQKNSSRRRPASSLPYFEAKDGVPGVNWVTNVIWGATATPSASQRDVIFYEAPSEKNWVSDYTWQLWKKHIKNARRPLPTKLTIP